MSGCLHEREETWVQELNLIASAPIFYLQGSIINKVAGLGIPSCSFELYPVRAQNDAAAHQICIRSLFFSPVQQRIGRVLLYVHNYQRSEESCSRYSL